MWLLKVLNRLSVFGAPFSRRCRIRSPRHFRPRLEAFEERLVPSSADGSGPVVTGLTSTPGSLSLVVTFDGPLALPATATLASQFQINRLVPGVNPEQITTTGASVPILSASYSSTASVSTTGPSASQVTLTLASRLTSGVFYRLFINGTPQVVNGAAVPGTAIFGGTSASDPNNPSNGQPFDGDNDDTPTGDFYGLFAVGTSLQFPDANGNQVSLRVSGSPSSALNVWRELNGNIDQLQVINGTGVTLTGSVTGKAQELIGSTTIPVSSAFLLNGATNKLPVSFLTPINFNATTTTQNGSLTNVLDVSSTAGLQVGQSLVGANLAVNAGTLIVAIDPINDTIIVNQTPLAAGTDLPTAAFPDQIVASDITGTIGTTDDAFVTTINGLSSTTNLKSGQLLVGTIGSNQDLIPPEAVITSVDTANNSITFTAQVAILLGNLKPGTPITFTAITELPAPPPSPNPVVATSSNLPYTVSVQPLTITTPLPGIQGAVYAQMGPTPTYPAGLWLILGGHTNGLHNFSLSGQNDFPPDTQNQDLIVINPLNWAVLADVPMSATDVPVSVYNSLASLAQEFYQNGDTLYAAGGYSSPISAVFTGTIIPGSFAITNVSSTTGLAVGQSVAFSDSSAATDPIPSGAVIVNIVGTTVTLNMPAMPIATESVRLLAFSDTIGSTFSGTPGNTPVKTFTGDTTSGQFTISNIAPASLRGLAAGQLITDSAGAFPPATVITALGLTSITVSNAATSSQTGDTFTSSIGTISGINSTASLLPGMTMTDTANAIPPGTVISKVGPSSITLSNAFPSLPTGDTFTASFANYTTYDTLTSLSISRLINALLNPTFNSQGQIVVTSRAQIQQIHNPAFQFTGGEMAALNGVTYLVGGQDFEGGYQGPTFVQTYSDEIQRFTISNAPLKITNYQALRDPVNFRRRDENLEAVIQPNGQPGLTWSGGVFTEPGQIPYTNPVLIGNGTAHVNSAYSQFFSQYDTANVSLFDPRTSSGFTIFMGGIGLFANSNGVLVGPQFGAPWVNAVTTLKTNASGADQEYIMPPIPPVTADGTGYYGAEAGFFALPGLPEYSNGVIRLNQLNQPTILGYLFGGIYSKVPESTNPPVQTVASNQVFAVILTPVPAPIPPNPPQKGVVTLVRP